ncbi:hypothetical protein K5X82_13320 [Halosquirtibacter xylanolyticus]|uniref:tetratricopeptide repeat protein n=1 Tax=Halosquirtibacter xylanolyticus TaxID=3374599 RepID=UPI00374A81A1|nr:hypothetical protein K5X82_13320 [Prolixibacteraceae bacterium]
MRNLSKFKGFAFFLIVTAMMLSLTQCSPIAGLQKKYTSSLEQGDYQAALDYAEALMAEQGKDNKDVPAETYLMAGKSALKLKQTDKALKNLALAYSLGSSDAEMLSDLALIYKQKGEMSKEMRVLNDLMKQTDSEYAKALNERYFMINVEAELYDKADTLWQTQTPAFKESKEGLTAYLMICYKLRKSNEVSATAKKLVKLDPTNYLARRTLAIDVYYIADDHYKKAMATYNKNKTRRNYAILLKELIKSGKNYRYALSKLKAVYKIQKEKHLALYISNVYARLNDKKMMAYYKRLSK